MYCSECGTKNEEGARYCGECGNQLKEILKEQPKIIKKKIIKKKIIKKVVKKKKIKEKEPMSSSKKILIGICSVLIIAFMGSLIYLSKITDPKTVATEYFEAVTSYNADKLYKYIDVEESEFVNKKVFKSIMNESLKDTEQKKVQNYNVTSVRKSDDGLTSTVVFSYTIETSSPAESSSPRTETVYLTKAKEKKFLFFNNWKVNVSELKTVKDFKISVMKGSTIKLEGIKINSKYLDKNASTEDTDVYVIPSLFALTYKANITLPLGFDIEDRIHAGIYSKRHVVSVASSSIPEATKKKITLAAKDSIIKIYEGATENKNFDDIKSNFEYDGGNLTKIQSTYESFAKKLTSATDKLTEIKFTDVTLNKTNISTKGTFSVTVKVNYEYTLTYTENEEEKTYTGKDSDTMYLTFVYASKTFKTTDFSSFETYFSKNKLGEE